MKNKGFTLVEIIAVIVVITILITLIIPNLLNSVNNKRNEISESARKMIYDATDIYVKENKNNFTNITGNKCVRLDTLVNNGKLVTPVKDLTNDKEIPLSYYVKVTLDDYNQYEYELVTECSEN